MKKCTQKNNENIYDKNFTEEFDSFGYSRLCCGRKGFNKDGFDPEGYDVDGFNREGWNRKGWDKKGYNINTGKRYDKKGFDEFGFNEDGIHKSTGSKFDLNGHTQYFFENLRKHTYDTNFFIDERGDGWIKTDDIGFPTKEQMEETEKINEELKKRYPGFKGFACR